MGARWRRVRRRLLVRYLRNHRLFWTLHSLWALATGVVVVALAHRRWALVGWVVVFLGVTWVSTFFFSHLSKLLPDSAAARLGRGFVSYLTRVTYQETLFFLLPFYFASATFVSWNLAFPALLAGLAVLACLDLVFDRLLREHRWFGLLFFSIVAFASLEFLLPLFLGTPRDLGTPVAAVVAFAASLPLVCRRGDHRRPRTLLQMAAVALLLAVLAGPGRALVPPVPVELQEIVFSRSIDPDELTPVDPLDPVARGPLEQIVVVARVFAPTRLEERVVLRWLHDGTTVYTTRELTISPHPRGFKVWYRHRPPGGAVEPGSYTAEIRMAGGQLIGRGAVEVAAR